MEETSIINAKEHQWKVLHQINYSVLTRKEQTLVQQAQLKKLMCSQLTIQTLLNWI